MVWTISNDEPAQGFPINIFNSETKIHEPRFETISGNIPIIFEALQKLLKSQKTWNYNNEGRNYNLNEAKYKLKWCLSTWRVDPRAANKNTRRNKWSTLSVYVYMLTACRTQNNGQWTKGYLVSNEMWSKTRVLDRKCLRICGNNQLIINVQIKLTK